MGEIDPAPAPELVEADVSAPEHLSGSRDLLAMGAVIRCTLHDAEHVTADGHRNDVPCNRGRSIVADGRDQVVCAKKNILSE